MQCRDAGSACSQVGQRRSGSRGASDRQRAGDEAGRSRFVDRDSRAGGARPDSELALVRLIAPAQPKQVRLTALVALQSYDDASVAVSILEQYGAMDTDLRSRARNVLCGRPAWSEALLAAVESGKISRQDVPLDQVRQILLHHDSKLDAKVAALWGEVQPATTFEKQQAIARIMRILKTGEGDASRGKALFAQTCGACHKLRGGNVTIGPDLTAYDRKDLNFLVPNIVDPSASIRPEYATYTLRTTDRRILNGPLIESGPQAVTIEDGTARNHGATLANPAARSVSHLAHAGEAAWIR